MIKEFKYDDLSVNDVFHSKFKVSQELAENYCRSLDMDLQKNHQVPSSVLAIYKPWYDAFGGRVAQGTIHLKQKTEYYHEVSVNDEFVVKVIVTGKYEKKGRDYLVHDTYFYKEERLYCKQTITQLWAFAQRDS